MTENEENKFDNCWTIPANQKANDRNFCLVVEKNWFIEIALLFINTETGTNILRNLIKWLFYVGSMFLWRYSFSLKWNWYDNNGNQNDTSNEIKNCIHIFIFQIVLVYFYRFVFCMKPFFMTIILWHNIKISHYYFMCIWTLLYAGWVLY